VAAEGRSVPGFGAAVERSVQGLLAAEGRPDVMGYTSVSADGRSGHGIFPEGIAHGIFACVIPPVAAL
jgi:hypothetical protein